MQPTFDSPFYRVSVKALIFDDEKRILVFEDREGNWEMPGGGWEHGESLDECLKRELREEMSVTPEKIGPVAFIYTSIHHKGYHKLCIAVPVTLVAHAFIPSGDDLAEATFVTKEEFLNLPFQSNEAGIKPYVDQIWPTLKR